jgi:MED6 mediator sub complex component
MSETASFVDPVFLARFGLGRVNVLDYFLHPLNPFRTTANTSNEVLAMQGIGVGVLMAHGTSNEGPISAVAAEDEYKKALSRLTGEQYELLPPAPPKLDPSAPPGTRLPTMEQVYLQPSQLYTIRHVLRTSATSVKVLGIYYVVEGVIYKAPAARSLMKTNVARTAVEGLSASCTALAACARYHPATNYHWVFESDTAAYDDPVALYQLARKKRRKVRDNRRLGERTAAEEEGIRASEAIDQILVRLSKSISNSTRQQQQQQQQQRNQPSTSTAKLLP